VTVLRNFIYLFVAVFLFAGCVANGGADAVPPPPMSLQAYDVQTASDDAAILRIAGNIDEGLRGIPGTNWSSVPVAGQALFLGIGQGAVGDLTFRGDAVVTIDFSEDDITGGIQNIVGADATRTYTGDGAIILSGGDLRLTRPTDFAVDYAGTLDFGIATVELDGTMTGLLRGTRLGVTQRSPIKALSAADTDGMALVDGVPTDIDLTIVGETR